MQYGFLYRLFVHTIYFHYFQEITISLTTRHVALGILVALTLIFLASTIFLIWRMRQEFEMLQLLITPPVSLSKFSYIKSFCQFLMGTFIDHSDVNILMPDGVMKNVVDAFSRLLLQLRQNIIVKSSNNSSSNNNSSNKNICCLDK